MLLASGVAIATDFSKGLPADRSGDLKTALAEWTLLADQGNAGAPHSSFSKSLICCAFMRLVNPYLQR